MEIKADSQLQTSPAVNVSTQNDLSKVNTSISLKKNNINIDAENKSY
jgi:hypothetical protein